MNRNEIRAWVNRLSAETQTQSMGLEHEIIASWRTYVLMNIANRLEENLDETALKASLRDFLHHCFEMSLGSVVSYTASPESEITRFLIALAHEVNPEDPLHALMPRVSEKSQDASYRNLSEYPIEQLLNTHILSDNGAYLYPVELLTSMKWRDNNPPLNPYHHTEQGESHAHLSQAEYARLMSHSASTEAISAAPEASAFREAQDKLKRSLDDGTYKGREKNKINLNLLALFKIKVDLIDLLQNLSENDADHFLSQLLLSPELTQELLEKMPDFNQLQTFIERLSPRQQVILIKKFRPNLIKGFPAFSTTLDRLPDAQRHERMKNILMMLIENGLHFNILLKHSTAEQRTEAYEIMKPVLPTFIKNVSDLDNIFKYLTSEQRAEVYEAVHDKIPSFFKDAAERDAFLRRFELNLPNASEATASAPETVHGSKTISRFTDFEARWSKLLTSEARTAFYEDIKTSLPIFIKMSMDLNTVLQPLTPEQRTEVYEIMKTSVPNLINSAFDFNQMLTHLTQEQRTEVYEIMKASLPNLIKCAFDFKQVLAYLTQEQRVEIFEQVKDKISEIFTNPHQRDEYLQRFELKPTEASQETPTPRR